MPNNFSVKQISCGSNHSLLLTTEGNVYSFGYNHYGQLGLNHKITINIPTLVVTTSKFSEILAFDCQSFAKNESNIIEFWGQIQTEEIILSPRKTNVSSLQEAIILCNKNPFTIKPIILNTDLNKKSIEPKMTMPSNRLVRAMVKGFNNPTNSDFKFKIKRQECDDSKEDLPTDDSDEGFLYIYCHKWFVEEKLRTFEENVCKQKVSQ